VVHPPVANWPCDMCWYAFLRTSGVSLPLASRYCNTKIFGARVTIVCSAHPYGMRKRLEKSFGQSEKAPALAKLWWNRCTFISKRGQLRIKIPLARISNADLPSFLVNVKEILKNILLFLIWFKKSSFVLDYPQQSRHLSLPVYVTQGRTHNITNDLELTSLRFVD